MSYRLTFPQDENLLEHMPLETALEVERALSGLVRHAESVAERGGKGRSRPATSRFDVREFRVTCAVDPAARHVWILSVKRAAATAG